MTRSIPTAYLVVLAAVLAALQVLLGVLAIADSSQPAAAVLAMIIFAALMVGVLLPPRTRLRGPLAAAVVGGTVAIAVLVQLGLTTQSWPGYAAWHLAALQCLLVVVALRGSWLVALLACGLFAVSTVWWSGHTTGGFLLGARMILAPVLFVLVAVALARFLARNDRRAEEDDRRTLGLLDQAKLADASRVEALSWTEEVALLARPSLQLAADPDVVLTDQDRTRMLQVEAALRDRIRGGVLAVPDLLAVAGDARRRGLVVQLLDDRAEPLTPGTIEQVSRRVLAVLSDAGAGELTVRARPVHSAPPEVTIAYVPQDPKAEAVYAEI